MIRVGRRVGREAGAVEVDAVVVDEVRILSGIHAARAEPDLALVFVDAEHVAHDPFALGDLLLDRAGDAVIEIQVVPAVAFRHPDDFLAVGDVEAVTLARVRKERFRLLADDRSRLAGQAVDRNDAIDLMTALVVFERHGTAVFAPGQRLVVVGIRKQRIVDEDLLLAIEEEQHWLLGIQHVAWLWRTGASNASAATGLLARTGRSARSGDSRA